jgi:hypothetical protein
LERQKWGLTPDPFDMSAVLDSLGDLRKRD